MERTYQEIQAEIDGRRRNALVYFVAGAGMVKIGFSEKPRQRFIDLCNNSPVPLYFLGVVDGGNEQERILHNMFFHLWHHGEWFRDTIELRCYIAANARPYVMKKRQAPNYPPTMAKQANDARA